MTKNLRVGFNAYLLSSPDLRGWVRYILNLLAALPAHGVRPVLYSTATLHADHLARLPLDSYEVRISPPMRYLTWENVWLPRQLKADSIDVFHCPMNYGMPMFTNCPRVLTLHDVIDIVYYIRRMSNFNRLKPSSLRTSFTNWVARVRADRIITISEHAKRDIIKHLRVPNKKLTVVYEAADPQFHRVIMPAEIERSRCNYKLAKPYFFYLGGWEERKNLPFFLHCFAAASLADEVLVLGGGKPAQQTRLFELSKTLGIADRVKFLGFVPEADLPSLYAGALAFVYPSKYEGFGLQVCEAMAAGCPVFVANSTSLPEIAGEGGELFSLNERTELADLLRKVATDSIFRKVLVERARLRSQNFSWYRTAKETASVYQNCKRHTD